MTHTPKTSWPRVRASLHSIYDQPAENAQTTGSWRHWPTSSRTSPRNWRKADLTACVSPSAGSRRFCGTSVAGRSSGGPASGLGTVGRAVCAAAQPGGGVPVRTQRPERVDRRRGTTPCTPPHITSQPGDEDQRPRRAEVIRPTAPSLWTATAPGPSKRLSSRSDPAPGCAPRHRRRRGQQVHPRTATVPAAPTPGSAMFGLWLILVRA